MIVELIGLPGSGKSYLADSLRAVSTVPVIAPIGKISIVWGALCGAVLYPRVAIHLWRLYRRHYTPTLGRYLFINGVLYKLAKFFYARMSPNALYAEGMTHNLLSMWGKEIALQEAVVDLALTPKPDLILILQHEILNPEETNAYRAREKLTPGEARAWWEVLLKNYMTLQDALRVLNIPVVLVTRDSGLAELKKIFKIST